MVEGNFTDYELIARSARARCDQPHRLRYKPLVAADGGDEGVASPSRRAGPVHIVANQPLEHPDVRRQYRADRVTRGGPSAGSVCALCRSRRN